MTDPIAELRGASKRYGKLIALQHTDLAIRAGEVLAVLGPNGAGKTTALGLLTGRLSPDAGSVRIFGCDPRDWQARRRIGVMLQDGKLPETLSVAEHIRLYAGYYLNPRPLAETLELAGLTDISRRRFEQLSGGQQRRVQFALAICGRAPLLFVDEPTVGLDVESRRNFWQVLRRLRGEGASIVLTTHYLEEADALAERIVLLAGGRILAQDTPAGIKARASGKRVRCRTRLPASILESWPEASSVAVDGERTELRSAQPEALLRRLLAADAAVSELEVLPLSLEEAFLSLTSDVDAIKEAA